MPKRLRGVKSRGGGEEVPSLEKKIGACGEGTELKWGGRLLRNGARREYAIIFGMHGAGVGYAYARLDVSFGRLGEALSAGQGPTGRKPRMIERSGDKLVRRGAPGRLQALRRACRRRREVRIGGQKCSFNRPAVHEGLRFQSATAEPSKPCSR